MGKSSFFSDGGSTSSTTVTIQNQDDDQSNSSTDSNTKASSFFKDGGGNTNTTVTIQSQVDGAAASATSAAASATQSASSAANSASAQAASLSSRDAAIAAQAASEAARDTAISNKNSSNTNALNAAGSASAASTSASNASSSASSASSNAASSASAQQAAEAARDSALAAFDNFDDRYLGSKTSDPTTDNDGDALVGGSLYFNSSTGVMMLYNGSAWVAAYASTAGTLLVSNNLNDVQSAATSRTNLGLATVAATGAYSDLSGTPTIPAPAITDVSGTPTLVTGITAAEVRTAINAGTSSFDGAFGSLSGKPTTISGYGITDSFSGAYNDLTGKPTLFNGAFASLSGKPTTISGYGITDAFDGAFSSLSGKPTTISGYGITDSFSGAYNDLTGKPTLFDGAFSSLTGKPTTLSAYGITDGQQTLVSGTNIKTINGNSLLGSGNISISGGGGGATQDADGDTKIQVEEGTDDDTIRFDTAGSERMVISNTGQVGIGVTPVRQLHVNAGSENVYLHLTNAATGATTTDGLSILVKNSNQEANIIQREAAALTFSTSATERMRVVSGGGVGIATTALGTETLTINKLAGNTYGSIQLRRSDTANTNQGGILTFAQKDNAITSWLGIAGWDTGSDRTVYLGGGGWGKQEATKVQIYTGAYDAGSGGAVQQLLIDTSKVQAANALECEGGELVLGQDAYSASTSYVGLKTSFQSGVNDYMMISGTSDGATYVSSKDGSSTHIRGGGNYSTNEIVVPDGGNPYAAEEFNIGSSSTLSGTGQLNLYRSSNPYIGWYSGSTSRGGYMQYLSDYFLFGGVSYSQSDGSFRAPIFYDSDNTSYYTNPGSVSYMEYIGRRSHSRGFLVGGHNNIGSTSTKSCPIYTIGSSYTPNDSSLGNMYGIGFTHTNASFIGFAGSAGWGMYVASDGDARVYLSGQSGSGHFTGNITAYASDERLKTNIKPVENALEKVCQLRGVEFDWVDNITSEYDFHPQTMHETGVLAQNVAEHIPDAVTEAPMNANYTAKNGTDHQFLTVDKEKIIPVLIEAIKELKAEIDMLKGEADV